MKINKFLPLVALLLTGGLVKGQTYLVNESFTSASGSTPPSGWNNNQLYTTVAATDFWRFDNPGARTPGGSFAGTFAIFDDAAYSNDGVFENIALETPAFSTIGVVTCSLSFDYAFLAGTAANGYVEAFDGNNWVIISTYTATTSGTNIALDISNTCRNLCNAKVRFRWSTNSGGWWAVDNVKVYYSGTPNTTDARVVSFTPKNGSCASSTMQFTVNVKNEGTSSIGNFPVKVSVFDGTNTTTITQTAPSSIAPCSTATITFSSTINMGNAALTYDVKVYTELTGDQNKSNSDTVYAPVFNVQAAPSQPSNQTQLICGFGAKKIGIALNPGDLGFWYSSAVATSPFFTGDSVQTPVLTSDTVYYVETFRATIDSLPKPYTRPPTAAYAAGNATGMMINITATANVVIDSFSVYFRDAAGTAASVEFNIRNGSYVGYETTSAGWTSLGTTNTVSNGGFTEAIIRVPGSGITIAQGQTIGILITSNRSFEFSTLGTLSVAGNDISLYSNNVQLGPKFSPTQYLSNYSTPGKVYYKKTCKSNRVSVTLNVRPRPSSDIVTGTPFKGTYINSAYNSYSNFDHVKALDTLVYEVLPPAGLTNSSFGTSWIISSVSMQTPNGTGPSDTVTYSPTPTSNGKLMFVPSAAMTDSLFILTVTLQNAAGCDSTIIRYIYVAPVPVSKFGNSLACAQKQVSFSDSSTIIRGSLSYVWSFGDPLNSTSVQKNPKFFYSSPGTYTVKLVTTSDLGYRDSLSRVITVANTPVVKFSNTNGCLGDTTRFTNLTTIGGGYTIAGYVWDFGNSTSDIQTNPKTVYLSTGIYNVRLIATTNVGCSDTLDKPVSVFAKPIAAFTTPANLCAGTPASFNNTSTLSNGQMGVNWSFGDGETDFNISPAHQYLNAGSYSVKLKVYSNFGCFDSVTKTVVVAPTPNASFTYANACTRDSVTFINTTTFGGTGTVNLTWTFGDAATANTTGSVKHKYLNAGTYNASLKAQAGACFRTQNTSINVNTRPVAAFTTSSTCVNTPVQFSNTSIAGNSATSSWAFGDGGVASSQSPTHSYTTAGNVNAKLVVMENNCYDSVSVPLTIHALPVVSFTSTPMAGIRQLQFNPNNPSMISYEWDMGDGSILSQINPVYSFMSNGPFNVTLTASDSNGCANSKTNQVSFNVSTGKMPDGLSSFDVYPNPFSNQTNISYTVAKTAKVEIKVYDMLGKEITTLVNATQSSGSYQTLFSLNSVELNSGSYIVKIAIDGNIASKQIIAINR